MTDVVKELADLKVAWEGKLNEVSAGLEEAVAMQQAQTEFSKLQKQQAELREEVEVLSRYSKLNSVLRVSMNAIDVTQCRLAHAGCLSCERLKRRHCKRSLTRCTPA